MMMMMMMMMVVVVVVVVVMHSSNDLKVITLRFVMFCPSAEIRRVVAISSFEN